MNSVVLSGRLTRNIELKETSGGSVYTRFSIAVDKYSKDKSKTAIFVDCIAFNYAANFLNKYCRRGQKVIVSGELDVRNVDGDDGKQTRYWSVVVNQVEAEKPITTDEQPFEM